MIVLIILGIVAATVLFVAGLLYAYGRTAFQEPLEHPGTSPHAEPAEWEEALLGAGARWADHRRTAPRRTHHRPAS